MSLENTKEAASGVPSIISPDLQIAGNLKSKGEIQIDGTVKGDIECPVVTIGEQGNVDGFTVAETVRIFGTVSGWVQAKTIHLDKSAKVTADITHQTLTIDTGAYFEGELLPLKGANSALATKL